MDRRWRSARQESQTTRINRARNIVKRAIRPALYALLLALCAAGANAQGSDPVAGRWSMEALPEAGRLQVVLMRNVGGGGKDNRYFKISLAELSGLSREQVEAANSRAKFQLRRAAGTFDFEGVFSAGKGAGGFTFSPDPAFVAEMERNGYGEAVRQNLLGFAIGNYETLSAELSSLGLGRPTADQLKSMNLYGVNADFIRELTALGYRPRSIDQLISLRLYGASVDFIKSLAAAGYERPTLDELISMKLQGVTLSFIEELRSLGYERIPLDQLISMRMQGITPDFIRGLEGQGYGHVPVERLFDVRMFKMPAELLNHIPAVEPGANHPEWLIKFYGRGKSRAWMLWRERAGVGGHSVELTPDQLSGLSEADAFSAGASVRFSLKLDGDEFGCVGWFKEGFGAGHCDAPRANKAAAR